MNALPEPNHFVLPAGMAEWIESSTGSRIVGLQPAVGAGVSREGCFVTLEKRGDRTEAYLAYDLRRVDDHARQDFSRREASALQLAGAHGLRVPPVIANWPERLTILTRRVAGEVKFDRLDEVRKRKLAEDYIGEIAKLHRIDVTGLVLNGFGPVRPPEAYARERIAFLRQRHYLNGERDPLLVLTYKWLEKRIPKGDLPTVLVHGDVGPANFLHDGERITAVLDWEQAHFGDPMEDFGWLMLRSALFPFLPPKVLIDAYERANGHPVDLDRIRYYRVLCETGSVTDMCTQLAQLTTPFAGHLGHVYAYYFALRKLLVEALAEAEGVTVPPIELPERPVESWDRLYDLAGDEIETNILPRCSDAVGAARARSLIRLIRYWQGRERYGAAFDEAEAQEIGNALGARYHSLATARAALVEAIETDAVSMEEAIRISFRRVARDIAMARSGLGDLADSSWPPLS